MRCKACDTIMTDYELTRVAPNGQYYDMCSDCVKVSKKAVSDIDATVDIRVDREYEYLDDDVSQWTAGGDEINNY